MNKYKRYFLPLLLFSLVPAFSLSLIHIFFVKPLTDFFEFNTLSPVNIILCIGIGFVSVIWFELAKLIRRMRNSTRDISARKVE